MRRYFSWWGVVYVLTLILACNAKTENYTIIAKVGDKEITFESLDEKFVQSLEYFEDSLEQRRAALSFLDSLVYNQLLIRAAYQAKLDQDREINILIDEQKPRLLIDELYKMVILEKAEPTTKELKDYYNKSGEQRKLRHILITEQAEAEEIYKQLKKGADFEQLAKEKSIEPGAKESGGDLGLVSWGSTVDEFQQAAWKLKAGQISKPVKSPFGWHIIKLEEIKKLEQRPHEEVMKFQKERIKFAKQTRLTQEFLDQLKEQSEVKLDQAAYSLLVERDSLESKNDPLSPTKKPSGSYLKPELFSESERNLPLVEYKGGEITIQDFMNQYARIPQFQRGSLLEKDKVEQLAFQIVMGDLLEKEAQKRKADSRPDFKKNILTIKESLMADKMRNDMIMMDLKVTDQDLRDYYDSHLEQFQTPEMVKIQEVLVASKEEGDKLAKQIRAGADLARIARQHTLRPGMKEKGGVLDSITTSNSAILFEAVKGAKKGQIVGPVPFRDKFSVIKLLERTPSKQLKFEEVQPRLRGLAYEDKKKSVFDNWIEARKRVDQVEVYPDLYWQKVSEKLAALMTSRPQGSRQSIKGQLPLKIKVGPEGKIEKVEDDSL
ncbi:MAG: hypothetical protein A2Z27_02890 [candidate division Zixibacteria bacterium RBG_16_50_21]|nr:MAG: hypothetical protein A2Z27_02890 [candidate division Zixibacteria bacterium RBG_16_50_21]